MESIVVNRVAESEIEVFNLEDLWDGRQVTELDLVPYLFRGLILKEKEFRLAMKEMDWSVYQDQHVAVYCSTKTIIPRWAFVLIASKLNGVAASVGSGRAEHIIRDQYIRVLDQFDWSVYADKIVVLKGCGSDTVPENAYLVAAQKIQNVARKLLYGEPCSSVPVWRRK